MQTSISLVIVFVIALIAVLIISAMLTGGFGTLEQFGTENMNLSMGGL